MPSEAISRKIIRMNDDASEEQPLGPLLRFIRESAKRKGYKSDRALLKAAHLHPDRLRSWERSRTADRDALAAIADVLEIKVRALEQMASGVRIGASSDELKRELLAIYDELPASRRRDFIEAIKPIARFAVSNEAISSPAPKRAKGGQ